MGVRSKGVLYLPVYVCEGAYRPIRIQGENGKYAGFGADLGAMQRAESSYYRSIDPNTLWGVYDYLHQDDDLCLPALVCYLGPEGFVTREQIEGGVI